MPYMLNVIHNTRHLVNSERHTDRLKKVKTMPLPSPFHSVSRHSLSASLVPTDSPKRSGKLNKTQVGLKENMWVSVDEVPSVHMLTSVIEWQSN